MTDTLLMPEHGEPHLCRSTVKPGYALQMPDGRLHCNRCGWVTPEPVITAYNPDTGNTYLDWDALVAAETNGYVIVSISERPRTVPSVHGPWPSKADARKAQDRLRKRFKKEEAPYRVATYIRNLWPETLAKPAKNG